MKFIIYIYIYLKILAVQRNSILDHLPKPVIFFQITIEQSIKFIIVHVSAQCPMFMQHRSHSMSWACNMHSNARYTQKLSYHSVSFKWVFKKQFVSFSELRMSLQTLFVSLSKKTGWAISTASQRTLILNPMKFISSCWINLLEEICNWGSFKHSGPRTTNDDDNEDDDELMKLPHSGLLNDNKMRHIKMELEAKLKWSFTPLVRNGFSRNHGTWSKIYNWDDQLLKELIIPIITKRKHCTEGSI